MKTQVNIGLEGAFKVDIFSGKKFIESTDWFANFITPTGLTFPQIYPFVDCFRFLSLGSNNVPDNQGGCYTGAGLPYTSQLGTTGLSAPIPTYMTQQGTQESGQYIGWQGYANGSDGSSSACGTLLTEQGLKFYRAWNIPTGGVNGVNCTMSGTNNGVGLVINEFMVSPSSGSDPTGRYAFSRVRRTVTIKEGYSAIISYQLSVNFSNTGLTYFGPNTFSTGSADVTSDPDNDQQLISDWANLSGYYRHVYHGLNIINQAGAHDIPADYGAGMEPSLTDLSDYCFYLSPDNSNFDISTTGAPGSNEASAYAADGLMGLVYGIQMSPFLGTQTLKDDVFYGPTPVPGDGLSVAASIDWPQIPTNIRIGSLEHCSIPSVTNYVTGAETSCGGYQMFNDASQYDISYATPGALRKKTNEVDYKQQAIFSTRVSKLPIDTGNAQNTISGRTKTVTRKTLFSPVSSLGWNTRFGSLVFATNTPKIPGSNIYSPIIDTLFFDTSGRSLMQHYRYVNVVFDERGSGVADCRVDITPHAENINIFRNAQTYQAGYDPSLFTGNSTGLFLSGDFDAFIDGQGPDQFSLGNCSGWGCVLGLVPSQAISNNIPDCGLYDHNVVSGLGGLTVTNPPTKISPIYWPDPSQPLVLHLSDIKYYSTGDCFTEAFVDGINIIQSGIFYTPVISPLINYSGTLYTGNIYYTLTITGFQRPIYPSYFQSFEFIDKNLYSGILYDNSTFSIVFNGVFSGGDAIYYESHTGLLSGNYIYNGITNTGITDVVLVINGDFGIADLLYNTLYSGQIGSYGTTATPLESGDNSNNSYNWGSNPCGFVEPIAHLEYYENIGTTGFRLLPNYAAPNNQGNNYYSVTQGGALPGTSFNNGIELYQNIIYSAKCSDSVNCVDS
jgi:hypothetical protein